MTIKISIEIANQINNGDGYLINWRTLPWLISNDKGGSESPRSPP